MFDLKALAEHLNITQMRLAEVLETDQSQVSLMMNKKRRIRLEHIEKLRARYGDIVDVYRTDAPPQRVPAATMSPAPEHIEPLRDVSGGYGAEPSAVGQLPLVPDAVLRNPDADIIAWTKSNEAQQDVHLFDISDIFKRTKFVIKTDDDSMSPTLFQNEYVFMRPIDRATRIVDGKCYGVETTTAEAMIRILYDQGDSFLAVAVNKQYGDMHIPKTEVVRLHQIIFHGSTRLSIVADQSGEVVAKDGQIAQQGAQIDSLIAQLDKSGERVDRLIDMIEKK